MPGLDGTGLLFQPLLELMPPGLEREILSSERDAKLGYKEHASFINRKLIDEPTIIIAESYSARIAYELCCMTNKNIKHVIFVAGFLTRPSMLSRFANFFPIKMVKKNIIPRTFLNCFLFGKQEKTDMIDLFYQALNETDEQLLKHRLNNIIHMGIPSRKINVPSTYIRPKNDYLVSKKVLNIFEELCSDFSLKNVQGGHFILQSNPLACWEIIKGIIEQTV